MGWQTLTVTASSGSKTVSVVSGSTANIKVGDALQVGAFSLCEITGVYAGQLTIKENWSNATQTGASASVIPTFGDFNTAVSAINKLKLIINDNYQALNDWTAGDSEVTFTGLDGITYTVKSASAMEAFVNGLETGLDTRIVEAIAEVTLPEPDVYIPFNDSLQIVRGYGTHDKIDVSPAQDGSVMIELPTKSVDFSRASRRTYINKSRQLVYANEDEPRIGVNGFISESSTLNLLPFMKQTSNGVNTVYSDSTTPFLDTTFSNFTVDSLSGETYKDVQAISASDLTEGEVYTFSVFINLAETTTETISVRCAYGITGSVKYDPVTDSVIQGVAYGAFERHGNLLRLSLTGTYTGHENGVLCRVQAYDRELGQVFSSCGPQFEKSAWMTCYVAPKNGVTTASSFDLSSLPLKNNMPQPGESFSISAIADIPDGVNAIFGFGRGTLRERLTLWRFGVGRKVAFRLADNASYINADSGALDDYGPCRFTAVFDASKQTISLYVDGDLGSTIDASMIDWSETYSLTDTGNLGKCRDSGSNEASLGSWMKEFKIYHHALTAAQVKAGG